MQSPRKCQKATFARWPKAVHVALWPYALHFAAYLHSTVPILEDSTLQLEKFSSTSVGFNMRHFHTFACPVFALHSNLAAGSRIPKWSPQARLGLNLGPSPYHALNINLVLHLSTGLVSPQYHREYNDFCETVQYNKTRFDELQISNFNLPRNLMGLMTSFQDK